MRGLTARQLQCLTIIRAGIASGKPPTMREIGRAMGIRSTNGINDYLRSLEAKGYIRRDPMRARGIAVLVHQRSGTFFPVVYSEHGSFVSRAGTPQLYPSSHAAPKEDRSCP